MNVTTIYTDRYNEGSINTTLNQPTSGNNQLPEVGFFVYHVHYQDSTTNLDPDDVSVKFLAEIGRCEIKPEP